jgi:hypothetical protein
MKLNDLIAKVWLLPIYVLLIYTWLITGLGKALGDGVPESFVQRFSPTFLAQFPGIPAAYYQIAFFEIVAGLLFLASLIKGEFLPGVRKNIFYLGILLSQITFAMLGFGLRLVSDHSGAANIFFYMGATMVFALCAFFHDQQFGKK